MIPTSLRVFDLQFSVDTPLFLKEAAENCEHGMYPICWLIFKNLLGQVAVRASELDDPIMNVLMLRLNLYDIDDGASGQNISKDPGMRNQIIKEIQKTLNNNQ